MNKKRTQQLLLTFIICVLSITLLLMYSYKTKFNISNLETFIDTFQNTFGNKDGIIDSTDINTINKTADTLNKIKEYKTMVYNKYDPEVVNKYKDELKLSEDVFNFENNKFELDFYQKLQDTEIKDLNKQYEVLANELKDLNMDTKPNGEYKLKHIPTGIVLGMYNYNPNIANTNFNIILNKNKSMCLEFKALDPNYIDKLQANDTINNIEKVSCDFGNELNTDISDVVKNLIKKQKFVAIKISNNTDYNNNLHSYYEIFKIPEYNLKEGETDFTQELNNYPYYIIKPMDNTEHNLCLTIKNNMISMEPCDGNDYQKFEIVKL